MLDYTIAAYNKIKEDFNKLLYYSTICTQLLYMAYLIYALITGTGIFIANMILFVVAGAYFAFFLLHGYPPFHILSILYRGFDAMSIPKRIFILFTTAWLVFCAKMCYTLITGTQRGELLWHKRLPK